MAQKSPKTPKKGEKTGKSKIWQNNIFLIKFVSTLTKYEVSMMIYTREFAIFHFFASKLWHLFASNLARRGMRAVSYKRLGAKIGDKREDQYNTVMNVIRTKLSFSLVQSMITCIRGSRSVEQNIERISEINISNESRKCNSAE